MHELSGVLAIAHRDLVKLLRDRTRLIADLVFPMIFIGVLGTSLQAGFGSVANINLLAFVFTGVLGQTLWQSSAMGVISLIEDRENDFSQEIFVSPISRYSIVIGKVLGESLVALPQGLAIVVFAIVIGIALGPATILALVPVALVITVFGGAFGVLVLSRLPNRRVATQIFPFVMLPQYFLAGVFNPIDNLPLPLDIASRLAPMRYAIDLLRDVYYGFHPERTQVALAGIGTNLVVIGVMFAAFIVVGTALFVRAEQNR
ncbi:MAG TPA: ABC transporter permease [Candidatus Limnocylindria bacterium]|jgi:ABC-2 type transport system permease protein|nr:ABC transporter permease [Candidatus Limnocylindria bacterium]